MDPSRSQLAVTPWRSRKELLQLRHDLYGSDATRKERAVNKVFAWRLRKPDGLPLLLDSTADIVDVRLQDEKDGLRHNALRLLYATALSRFITGLADTQIDLTRDRPSWFPPGKSLLLPLPLLELRHRIVHRHLPSLAELKRASQDSLDWLWEWYWSQLDHAFGLSKSNENGMGVESADVIREKLQSILKTYMKERKIEIKTKKKDARAAESALSTYNLRYAPSMTSTPPIRTQYLLLRLLIDEQMILPAGKKLGSGMTGAFLIWDPFLLAFCHTILPVPTLLDNLMRGINAPARTMVSTEMDPIKESLYDWTQHILRSDMWREYRPRNLAQDILTQCFSAPTYWNLNIADGLLKIENLAHKEQWLAVLRAAKNIKQNDDGGEEMDVDVDVDVEKIEDALPVCERENVVEQKSSGPRKVIGLWKPRPIGWLPEGWEDDE